MIELGIVDEKLLKQMGFDDVAALGVKPLLNSFLEN